MTEVVGDSGPTITGSWTFGLRFALGETAVSNTREMVDTGLEEASVDDVSVKRS